MKQADAAVHCLCSLLYPARLNWDQIHVLIAIFLIDSAEGWLSFYLMNEESIADDSIASSKSGDVEVKQSRATTNRLPLFWR